MRGCLLQVGLAVAAVVGASALGVGSMALFVWTIGG